MRSRILILFIFISSCGKEAFVRSYPTVTTQPPVILYNEGAMFSGSFNNATTSDILQHGFVWGEKDDLQVGTSYTVELGVPQNTNFNATVAGTFTSSKEYFVRSYITTSNYTIYGNVQKFVSKGSEGPIITDFHPKSGFQNDTIVIKGRNFFASKSNPIKVRFTYNNADNYYTTVLSVTEMELKILVPTELPLPISWIVVDLPGNAGANSQPFTLLIPQILGSSPGAVKLCDSIYVAGKNFKALTSVTFDGKGYPFANHGDTIRFPVLEEFKTNTSLQLMAYKVSAQTSFSGSFASPQIINVDKTTLFPGDTLSLNMSYIPSCEEPTVKIESSGQLLPVVGRAGNILRVATLETICLPGTFNLITSINPASKSPTITTRIPDILSVSNSLVAPGDLVILTLSRPLKTAPFSFDIGGSSASSILSQDKATVTIPEAYYVPTANPSITIASCGISKTYNSLIQFQTPVITDFTPKVSTLLNPTVTVTGDYFSTIATELYYLGTKASIYGGTHTYYNFNINVPGNPWITATYHDYLTIKVGALSTVSAQELVINYTGPWTPLTDFPGTTRKAPVSFSANGKGYVMLGTDGTVNFKDVWEFDPSNNSWTQLSDFPGAARRSASFFVLGNKAYLGLGNDGTTGFKDVWLFEATSHNWTQLGDFPGGERLFSLSFAIGNNGYWGGGLSNNQQSQSDFWSFDPAANSWSPRASLQSSATLAVNPTQFVYNGNAYYFTSQGGTTQLWRYNPLYDRWGEEVHSFTGPIIVGPVLSINNGALIVDQIYDPEHATSTQAKLPQKRVSGVQFVINNLVYLGLGYELSNTSSLLQDFGKYDPGL